MTMTMTMSMTIKHQYLKNISIPLFTLRTRPLCNYSLARNRYRYQIFPFNCKQTFISNNMATNTCTTSGSTQNEQPWHTKFPSPKTPDEATNWLPQKTLFTWLSTAPTTTSDDQHKYVPGKHFILVDLRRVDHQGGTIHGSINLPAQSLWWGLESLYWLVAGTRDRVAVFYCGSSRGRGSRAARWLQEYADSQVEKSSQTDPAPKITSYALEGGVRGWASAGKDFTALMDGYDEVYWKEGGRPE